MTTVFLFPGQSSRDVRMMARIVAAWPPAAAIIDKASDILVRDLAAHFCVDNASMFAHNRDVQVGVFLCSYLHQQALAAANVTGDLSLGLSLGEYNHLVHIGALDFESALRLVDARGSAYERGPEGVMASIFPMPLEELVPYMIHAQEFGALEIANLNSPSQNVIAGEGRAVEAAIRLIEDDEPAVQAVVIEQRIPMHTPMFRPVATELRPHLEAAAWRSPAKPYMPNVLGGIAPEADASCFTELLERHVYSPVHWRRSIEAVAASHRDTRFVEVGPGAVLFNLLQKRWLTNRKFKTDDPSGTPPLASDELLGVVHGS